MRAKRAVQIADCWVKASRMQTHGNGAICSGRDEAKHRIYGVSRRSACARAVRDIALK